jgi:hypothetical protein
MKLKNKREGENGKMVSEVERKKTRELRREDEESRG